MLDDQTFQLRCDAALDDLFRSLSNAADEFDFEVDQNAGALTLEFDRPKSKFVVSPNSPVRQIWVSALTKSFKLDWNAQREAFVLNDTGATLKELMADVISQHIEEEVELT